MRYFSVISDQSLRICDPRSWRAFHSACLVHPVPSEGWRLHRKCCKLVTSFNFNKYCFKIMWHSLSYNAINTILILNFQVKILWDSASVKRYTSAGGKEGKHFIDCYWTLTLLLLSAKFDCLLTYCWAGKHPPPPSALRGHVPGVHRGDQPQKIKVWSWRS